MLTGENIFGLEEGFQELIDNHAVDIIHPDPGTSGAIRETKRIADCRARQGHSHRDSHGRSAGGLHGRGPHVRHAPATLVAMENHAVDMPWWQDLVTGPAKPIVQGRLHRRCPTRRAWAWS